MAGAAENARGAAAGSFWHHIVILTSFNRIYAVFP